MRDCLRIYHFCATRDFMLILRNGIRLGAVALLKDKGYEMYTGYNWLTFDGEAKNQSWNTQHLVKYSRCDYRLTVEIPEQFAEKLLDRGQLEEIIPGSHVLFDDWPGSENWRVFKGMIPPEWITEALDVKKEQLITILH